MSLLATQQLLSVLYKINTLAVSIFDCYVTVQCISTIIIVPSLGLDPIKNEDIFKIINGGKMVKVINQLAKTSLLILDINVRERISI